MVNAKPHYEHLQITPLHPTFVAEVSGVDWSQPVPKEVNDEIADAAHHYGVLVFKKTGLDDERHIQWAKNFGELDSILQFVKPGAKTRLAPYYDLWDAGNLDVNGNIIPGNTHQYEYNKGNALWHVDNSSKYPRYSYSALLAHEIPEQGGATQFSDVRTAYEDLPPTKKDEIEDFVILHSLWHSRKLASPGYEATEHEKSVRPGAKHRLVQTDILGRKTLYVATHGEYVIGYNYDDSQKIIGDMIHYCTQDKYVHTINWESKGDFVMWDNRIVMHRATNDWDNIKYRRDMRRTSNFDTGPGAWGPDDLGQGQN